MGDPGIPQPGQIPDTSDLPIEAPQSELNLQNASQAMTPQVQAPAGNKTVLKSLLTNFFQGAGAAMMKHAGLETPEEQQQRQFQNQITQQNAKSLSDLRDQQGAALQLQPYTLPDGTTLQIPAKSIADITRSQITAASRQGVTPTVITHEIASAIPELAGLEGQSLPKPVMDLITRRMTANIHAQATQEKTPTEIALRIRADQGDQQAQRILQRMQRDKEAQRAALALGRPGGYINPETGVLSTATGGQAIAGGLVPAAPGAQAMSKQAQFGEMHTASQKLKESITNLDRDFTPTQIAKLQLAARSPDESILRTITDSMLGTENLTPAQQDFVIWLGQMNERLLSLRNVAGMGQGAQDLRAAIQGTLPNLKTGNREFALKKMQAVDNQINLLERGIPKFRGQQGGGAKPTHRFNPATGKIEAY